MRALFERFGWPGAGEKSFEGLDVCTVVGLMHDCAREESDERLLQLAGESGMEIIPRMRDCPMLAHGIAAGVMTRSLVGDVPRGWIEAMAWHTLGSMRMGYTGLCLFCADFTEPGRRYLTDTQRRGYWDRDSLEAVCSAVLDDRIAHWRSRGFVPDTCSLQLQDFLHSGGKMERN